MPGPRAARGATACFALALTLACRREPPPLPRTPPAAVAVTAQPRWPAAQDGSLPLLFPPPEPTPSWPAPEVTLPLGALATTGGAPVRTLPMDELIPFWCAGIARAPCVLTGRWPRFRESLLGAARTGLLVLCRAVRGRVVAPAQRDRSAKPGCVGARCRSWPRAT